MPGKLEVSGTRVAIDQYPRIGNTKNWCGELCVALDRLGYGKRFTGKPKLAGIEGLRQNGFAVTVYEKSRGNVLGVLFTGYQQPGLLGPECPKIRSAFAGASALREKEEM